MITPVQNEDDFRALLAGSSAAPCVLLKHSTTCPISAAAHRQFEEFASAHPEVDCRIVLVIEQRPLSRWIAEQTGITHQSPQAIVFTGGKAVWHASHFSITRMALEKAVRVQ